MQVKAIVAKEGRLFDAERPKPVPGPRDLLVRVHAVAVNPVDTIHLTPGFGGPSDQERILGWDAAGVVEAVGPEVTLFRPGDEVYYAGDITRPGAFSEFHVVDERLAGRKPRQLDFAEAAALPLTSLTAWEGLFERLALHPERNPAHPVLIIGAAGGVGSIAVQLARYAGLTVIGTASRPESSAWVRTMGAHHVIDHSRPFADQLRDIGYPQVPYVFALNVVDPHWENMMAALVPGGRLCTILPPRGPLDFRLMADKSITWSIEAMFTRPKHRTPDMDEHHRILTRLAEWVDAGKIRTTLRERLTPINAPHVQAAFEQLRSRRTIGKIVLEGF
ncbi:MAG: zinc-binding alcohol dehydrogenase family protein [Alicyclobacillaceae bacterium]|nr:zinc-binding alcohol dehydrogenase family protein [Alicyclobacillaceae bacterium]